MNVVVITMDTLKLYCYCYVIGITHKKPEGDQLDQANPVRNDETGLWQCPFCLKNDFPELSEVIFYFNVIIKSSV